MSDAKLASTHPRKARNTQLVKDPDGPFDAQSEALPPGCCSSIGWIQGVAVSDDIAIVPGGTPVSSSRVAFLGNGPCAPAVGQGARKRGPSLAGRRRSLGGVLGQILVKERTSLYNTIMVGSCHSVKHFSGLFPAFISN